MTTQHRTLDTRPLSDAPDHSPQRAAPIACHHCGVLAIPRVTRGTGPHAFRANCPHCGKFLRWVSRYSHEERVHRREQFRREALAQLLPTPKQLAYLLTLGYTGDMPANREAASAAIDRLLQGGR